MHVYGAAGIIQQCNQRFQLVPVSMGYNKKCVSHSGPFLEEVVGDDERIDLVRPTDNGHIHEIEQQVGRINRIQ